MGVPRQQYNHDDVAQKHLTINIPASEPGRLWVFGVTLTPNGILYYGSRSAAREIDDGALSAVQVNSTILGSEREKNIE